jgi:hypothetical protein
MLEYNPGLHSVQAVMLVAPESTSQQVIKLYAEESV